MVARTVMATDARRGQAILSRLWPRPPGSYSCPGRRAAQSRPPRPGSAPQAELIAPPPGAIESDNFVRSPDSVSNPVPETGLLERVYPQLTEQRRRLPAFFGDTQLQLHFRSFYFNRENDNDTANEAWTLGGWVRYQSGWLLDTFAMGAAYYVSLPAYAPEDRPGSLLLTPGQGEIGTFGEAWAALRYKDYAILRGYRQLIDEGYVNPQDIRMLPNTFEALLLSGQVGWAQYDVGYIWNIKPRDSNDFISMSKQAGALGKNEGLLLTALALTPIKDLPSTPPTTTWPTSSTPRSAKRSTRTTSPRTWSCSSESSTPISEAWGTRASETSARGMSAGVDESCGGDCGWARRCTGRATTTRSGRPTARGPATSRCR